MKKERLKAEKEIFEREEERRRKRDN